MNNNNRPSILPLGRFNIDAGAIERGDPFVREIMARVRIARAEMMLNTGAIEYLAFCDDWDLVPRYEDPPRYSYRFDAGDDARPHFGGWVKA